MTREEAIEYLEEFQREIDELYPDADGNGKAILDKQREPIALAISALRDLDAQENAKTPCDLCCYNPPSSRDGKPCTMCPASPVETNMQNGCDFARQLGFSGCTKCPIDCDVRQAPKEGSI